MELHCLSLYVVNCHDIFTGDLQMSVEAWLVCVAVWTNVSLVVWADPCYILLDFNCFR